MYDFSHAAAAHGGTINTVWKYVLFDHNDAEEQLLQAQTLAHEARVTELRFVITQLGPSSTRIVDESQIPRSGFPVNVRIENYKVSLEQLTEGLKLSERLLSEGKKKAATDSAMFVTNMLTRNLRTARAIPAPYQAVIENLTRVAGLLLDEDSIFITTELSQLQSNLPLHRASL
jgi:hypothetical protein